MEQTVWLTQNQIAVLFSTTQQNISLHIKNIIEENELTNDSVHKEYLYTALDGKDYKVSWYNLDMILAIGYRSKTKKAIEFRKWVTSVLKDYMLKGYAINDNRVIVTNENYITLTNKVLSLNERMNKLEQDDKYRFLDILLKNETLFDSLVLIDSLIRNAREVVTLIDPYVDIQTLNAFKNKLIDVKLFIITSKVCHLSQKDINLFLKEYGNLYVVYSPDYHDRYLIVDNTYYYHLGTSINYMGKRISQVTQITKKDIIDFLNRKCNEYIK